MNGSLWGVQIFPRLSPPSAEKGGLFCPPPAPPCSTFPPPTTPPFADWALDEYRQRAEAFCEELSREYYLHLAGRKPELDIEPVYQGFADLFTRDAVARLRELATEAEDGDERRRLRYLLHFSFDGLVG